MQKPCIKNVAHSTPPPSYHRDLKVKNLLVSEKCHVAYKIKGNQDCSNMVANILPADPLPPPPLGKGPQIKINFFQNMLMLHIK